ncbi:hypothetical protein ABKA04_003542 [Annulohypoxylon sp. FPYF3050]
MRFSLLQSVLLGFAATSTAIYHGAVASDPNAIGVVHLQSRYNKDDRHTGVVLGNGKCLITAAHAAHKNDIVFKNKKGQNNISDTDDWVAISSVHKHPMWTGRNTIYHDPSAYDFAVVELESRMDASPWKISQNRGGYQDITLYG